MIGSGHDREEALERVQRALKDLLLLGVKTNAGFLARLLAAPEVRTGELDTGLLERGIIEPLAPRGRRARRPIAAAAIETLALVDRGAGGDPWDALPGWRMTGDAGVVVGSGAGRRRRADLGPRARES